jgi:hypothetical protein
MMPVPLGDGIQRLRRIGMMEDRRQRIHSGNERLDGRSASFLKDAVPVSIGQCPAECAADRADRRRIVEKRIFITEQHGVRMRDEFRAEQRGSQDPVQTFLICQMMIFQQRCDAVARIANRQQDRRGAMLQQLPQRIVGVVRLDDPGARFVPQKSQIAAIGDEPALDRTFGEQRFG